MAPQDLLTYVVETLDRAGIDYMITGSIASSLQGEPRSTHDLDVVVAVRPGDVPMLLAAFPAPRFYVSEEAVREAIRTEGMFNVIDVEEAEMACASAGLPRQSTASNNALPLRALPALALRDMPPLVRRPDWRSDQHRIFLGPVAVETGGPS